MGSRCRWILAVLLLAPAVRSWADEQHAFEAAVRELSLDFYDVAEKHLKEFVQTYTNSAHLPEAILLQAEAQLKQTNYTAAIALLSAHQHTATNLADQYVFWLAEAHFEKSEYPAAAEGFARLVRDFPASTNRLEAAIREATARAQLADWRSVLALLQRTNGIFQGAARTNAGDPQVVQGYLLLSEAQLAQQDSDGAERSLEPLLKLSLPPGPAWQWNYLMGRIRVAQGRPEDALKSVTNMLALAVEAAQVSLRADTLAFQAGILERLGRVDEAIAAYTNNLAGPVSAERQRQALLKITELLLARNQHIDAMQMLDRFLKQYPTAPAADLVWLTLGELQLRQRVAGMETNGVKAPPNAPGATNYLQEAQVSFAALAKGFPQSPLFGKGQLDLGWCFWLENRMPESEKAFQAAVERLPSSSEQATAYFKLADAQFKQNDFTNALVNYGVVIEKFSALAELKTNLFEPALYQSVRAAVAIGNVSSASNAVARLLLAYPKGFHTERAVQ